MDEMQTWVKANVAPVYDADASGTLGAEAAVALAKKDGVTRLEIGHDVWAITQGRSAEELTRPMAGYSLRHRISNGLRKSPCRVTARSAGLRDGLHRSFSSILIRPLILRVMNWLNPSRTSGRSTYRAAKDKGLRPKAHVGEWGTADDVWRACEELELDEVQHGIAAAEAPAVVRFLADNPSASMSVRPPI
jgi:hypothetical protein